MDAELKAKWVKALRSGEYQQITRHLKTGDGHCCLGVLCEVAGLTIDGRDGVLDENGVPADYQPIERLFGDFDYGELTSRNDGNKIAKIERHTFAQIADYIEREL